ncbi:MAG: hypothetical protein SVV80_13335 [Planctomycetota bacterium]|nr:hypothetical protein [Planctomycetota bacterium]
MRKVRQVMSFCLVLLVGGFLQYVTAGEDGSGTTTGWESQRSLAEGIQPRMGRGISNTTPAIVFDVMGDDKWTMICGEFYGKFFGYYWDGGKWVPDRSRVEGLKDIGSCSAPEFVTDLTKQRKWTLIARNGAGKFLGFYWDGKKWASDPAAVEGLGVEPGGAALTVLDNLKGDSKRTLITGREDGTFKGYCWDGGKWAADPSTVAGLPGIGQRCRPRRQFSRQGPDAGSL